MFLCVIIVSCCDYGLIATFPGTLSAHYFVYDEFKAAMCALQYGHFE